MAKARNNKERLRRYKLIEELVGDWEPGGPYEYVENVWLGLRVVDIYFGR